MEDKKDETEKDFWKGVRMYLIWGVPLHHFDHFVPPKSDYQSIRKGYFGTWLLMAIVFIGIFLACVWMNLRGQ